MDVGNGAFTIDIPVCSTINVGHQGLTCPNEICIDGYFKQINTACMCMHTQ